jgi:superoxide reductase
MTKMREIYKCNICGNIVEVLHTGIGELVCCGQPMDLMEPKTEDSTKEKHVPFIQKTKNGILVKIGQNQDHPMEEKHYIEWIQVISKDAAYRQILRPGDKPQAEFPVQTTDVIAREYCNIHGLWKN